MSEPAAGWYPDPNDAARVRWWDGATWSTATQPDPRLSPVAAPGTAQAVGDPARGFSVPGMAPGHYPAAQQPAAFGYRTEPGAAVAGTFAQRYAANYRYARSHGVRAEMDREVRRRNPFGWTGLLLVIIALFINPFGLLSVVGVVFGIVGLVRANALSGSGPTGFAGSLLAVLFGVMSTIWFVVHFVGAMHSLGY